MNTFWKLLIGAAVLAGLYVIISASNPSLGNYITNLVTFNWDALDWDRVEK